MPLTITLYYAAGFTRKGKRANNEDYIFPDEGQYKTGDNLFLVCDGVGGANKGEVASRLVCESLSSFFIKTTVSDASIINKAIASTEKNLHQHVEKYPETTGMATTLTLVHINTNGVTVAHIGDSRIYHIRDGKILYKSEDHSFVQDLIKSGFITNDEARTHPHRNVINRAIQGYHKPVKPDVFVLQDIKAGDCFFLCSDGITESLNDKQLTDLLDSKKELHEILNDIDGFCAQGSRDNYSCYLVQVKSCEGMPETMYPQPPEYKSVSHEIHEKNAPARQESNDTSDGMTVITAHGFQKQPEPVASSAALVSAPEPVQQPSINVETLPDTSGSKAIIFFVVLLAIMAAAYFAYIKGLLG